MQSRIIAQFVAVTLLVAPFAAVAQANHDEHAVNPGSHAGKAPAHIASRTPAVHEPLLGGQEARFLIMIGIKVSACRRNTVTVTTSSTIGTSMAYKHRRAVING